MIEVSILNTNNNNNLRIEQIKPLKKPATWASHIELLVTASIIISNTFMVIKLMESVKAHLFARNVTSC